MTTATGERLVTYDEFVNENVMDGFMAMRPIEHAEAAAPSPRRLQRLGRLAIGAALTLGVSTNLMSSNHLKDATMLAQLGESDLEATLNSVLPISAGGSCAIGGISEYAVGNGLFKNYSFGWYASTWSSSRALEALYVDSLENPSCAQLFASSLQAVNGSYWSHQIMLHSGYDQGPTEFHNSADAPLVDDNIWMALIDIQEYARTRNHELLVRAEDVFRLAVSQVDPEGGGVYWQVQQGESVSHGRAAVSNAPLVILGVDLFMITNKQEFLKESKRIYSWVTENLYDPGTGLYNDHLNADGTVVTNKYTYVQGVVIGAMLAMNEVDPQDYPLIDPMELALTAINYFQEHNSYGNPAFDAIWAQNVMALASKYNQHWFTLVAQGSVNAALAHAPQNPASLEYAAGKAELESLSTLSVKKYPSVFLGTAVIGGH